MKNFKQKLFYQLTRNSVSKHDIFISESDTRIRWAIYYNVFQYKNMKYEMILCVTELSFSFTKRQYELYQIRSKKPCHIETSQLMSYQCRKSIG